MQTLGEIADVIGAAVPEGRRDVLIVGIGSLENAAPGQLLFLMHEKYLRHISSTSAAAVVAGKADFFAARAHLPAEVTLLEVPDAAAAMQRVLEHLALPVPRPARGAHATAVVAPSAKLGKDVAIGPHVTVGERVELGEGVILHCGVVLGDDVSVGDHSEMFVGVVVRERCTIGKRVIINANSVIGTDGFGYRWDGAKHAKQPHIGTVVIEDDVEIGSCTCIDRAKVDETRIGSGTKIDNLVQIGHNVRIGRHCIVCGGTSVGGSSTFEEGVIVAGHAAVADHTTLRAGVRIGGMAGIRGDVAPGQTLVGVPAVPYNDFLREQAALRRLPELVKTVRELAKRVAELETREKA